MQTPASMPPAGARNQTREDEVSPVCIRMQDVDLGEEGMEHDPLLKGIQWQVNRNEFWVVGGMHRSGKSTLLASLAMLQKPLCGKLELFGVNPWGADEANLMKQRLRVGLVFEAGARLLHKLTVWENVALPVCYHKDCRMDEARDRVEELLKFAGIEDLSSHLPGGLTRTFRQRASLARALTLSPELLLLDNPLAGVDLRERTWWLETVSALNRGHDIVGGKPMTVVVATNHLTPWVADGHNFALLHGSRWNHVGGVQELHGSEEPVLRDVLGDR